MGNDRKLFLREVNQKVADGEYRRLLDICDVLDEKGSGDSDWIRAQIFFSKNQLEAAEKSAVKAITKSPENYTYYRTLGKIIGALGNVDAAKACLQSSQFNDYINQKYFLSESQRLKYSGGENFKDQLIYSEPKRPLGDIIRISDPADNRSEFNATEIKHTNATVKVIEKGKVWFDGHNLCVYDQRDNLVDACTLGNPVLIERVRHNYEAASIEGDLGVVVARSSGNYFHWTTDVMPGFHLLEKSEKSHGKSSKYLVSHQGKTFQNELMEAAGLDLQSVFCANDQSGYYFSAEKIIVPVFRHAMAMRMGDWAVEYLRSLNFSEAEPRKSGRRIYISRRDVKSRGIDNEDEVVSFLAKYGFEDVALDGKTVSEQKQIFQQSDYIVAPHGAGLTNIIYCKPETTVFEFFGDFVQPCFRSLASICNLRYAHLSTNKDSPSLGSLEKVLNKNKSQHQNQQVDIDDLERVFRLLGVEKVRLTEEVVD